MGPGNLHVNRLAIPTLGDFGEVVLRDPLH